MPRPRKCRLVWFEPGITYFKPIGVPLVELEEMDLTMDELEAVRLKDLDGLDQECTAKKMRISQPTFHRLIGSARKKIATALINGIALRIKGGNYNLASNPISIVRKFICYQCGNEWALPYGLGRPPACPKCSSINIRRVHETGGRRFRGGRV